MEEYAKRSLNHRVIETRSRMVQRSLPMPFLHYVS